MWTAQLLELTYQRCSRPQLVSSHTCPRTPFTAVATATPLSLAGALGGRRPTSYWAHAQHAPGLFLNWAGVLWQTGVFPGDAIATYLSLGNKPSILTVYDPNDWALSKVLAQLSKATKGSRASYLPTKNKTLKVEVVLVREGSLPATSTSKTDKLKLHLCQLLKSK